MNKDENHLLAPSRTGVLSHLDRVALEDKVDRSLTPMGRQGGSENTTIVELPDMSLGIIIIVRDLLKENTLGVARTAMSVMDTEELSAIRQCVATIVICHWEVEAPVNTQTLATTTIRDEAEDIATEVADFDILLWGRRGLRMTVAFGGCAAGGGIRRKTTSETLAIRLTLDMCDLGRG